MEGGRHAETVGAIAGGADDRLVGRCQLGAQGGAVGPTEHTTCRDIEQSSRLCELELRLLETKLVDDERVVVADGLDAGAHPGFIEGPAVASGFDTGGELGLPLIVLRAPSPAAGFDRRLVAWLGQDGI